MESEKPSISLCCTVLKKEKEKEKTKTKQKKLEIQCFSPKEGIFNGEISYTMRSSVGVVHLGKGD